jgi:N-acylglucosamine-6-phosphate 2-epimerase
MEEVDRLVDAGADIIALDCTARERVDGKAIETFLGEIREKYPNKILMADISTFDEGITAAKAGAHLVSTTLNGYTGYTRENMSEPNYGLLERLAKECETPVIAEGRIIYPRQAQRMLELGAWSVVVGGAITRPKEITARFVEAIDNVGAHCTRPLS